MRAKPGTSLDIVADGSLSTAFRARNKAKVAISCLLAQPGERSKEIDEILIYLLCGLLNFRRVNSINTFVPAVEADIAWLANLFRLDVGRHLPVLVNKGLFIELAPGYVIQSTRLWVAIIDLLTIKDKKELH